MAKAWVWPERRKRKGKDNLVVQADSCRCKCNKELQVAASGKGWVIFLASADRAGALQEQVGLAE